MDKRREKMVMRKLRVFQEETSLGLFLLIDVN